LPSRKLEDCEADLVARFSGVKDLFEKNLPKWYLLITCTLRPDSEQLQAFLSGHSQLDPRNPAQRQRAMHLGNSRGKSRAIDVEIVSRASGRTADKLLAMGALSRDSYELLYLVLMLMVERHGLRSGNDWNQNGIAVGPDPKEGFFDAGHMELPQLNL
jgi:hypothetical protein